MSFSVNWLAVLVAAVVGFAIGAAWYMTLGKQWQAALGKPREQLGQGPTPFAFGFLSELVLAYAVAVATPALFGATSLVNGLLTGLVAWVGFVMTTMILNHRYQGAPWRLTLIDGAHLLLVMLAQGLVIGLFG